MLSQAILAGASAQLRNMATTAGNLLQRTRCVYFRDTAMPCNKREPGTGCPAITGQQPHARDPRHERALHRDQPVGHERRDGRARGRRSTCRAPKGPRTIPIGDFHLLPGNTPQRETVLEPGDLITHVTLPPPVAGSKQVYLKLRDRASYEFALASAAVVLTVAGGNVTRARVALGGVGHQTLALPRGREPRSSASRPTRPTSARRRRRPCATPDRRARTPSRSSWRSGASRTRCRRPRRADSAEGASMPTTQADLDDIPDRPRHAARGRAAEGHRKGAVHLGLPLSRDALCRSGRGDDRQRPRDRARHRGRREDARRARDLPSREHRKDLSLDAGAGIRRHRRRAPAAVRRRRHSLLRPVHRAGRRGHVRERQGRRRRGPRHLRQGEAERRHRPQAGRRARRRRPPRSATPSASRASAGTPRRPSPARPSSSTRPTSRPPRRTIPSSCRRRSPSGTATC